jgi:hypothetical protein
MRNNAHNAATKNIKKKKIFVLCAGEVSEVSIDKHGDHPINNRRSGIKIPDKMGLNSDQ